jgi:hypothetical protein
MAGAGYKLFATGDVLTAAQVNTYLMQQTVMVFASSAARTSALSGVLAEGMVSYLQDSNTLEVYDGAAWVGATGDITGLTAGTGISISSATGPVPTVTNSMATEITAKGDLIVGTGSGTFDNLAAGANGETIVADSSTATGLRYQANFAAGKNKIINGDFGIWQRGTSITPTSATWTFVSDRWQAFQQFSAGTFTVSRQTFTPGTAPVAGYEGQYFLRYQSASTNTGTLNFRQLIENVQTFAGQTVTFSYWAKASATISDFYVLLRQNFGSGGSTSVDAYQSGTSTITTSWQRFTATITVPSISGKTIGTGSALEAYLANNSTLASSVSVDFWGIQVEAGNTATAFQTATGTIQGELAACQRYYYQATGGYYFGSGSAVNTTDVIYGFPLPVTMRTTPSYSIPSFGVFFLEPGSKTFSSINANTGTTGATAIGSFYTSGATGLTAGYSYTIYSQTGSIRFSAEL